MKEIILTNYDFKCVSDLAHKIFITEDVSKKGKYDNFLAYCLFEAGKSYTASKGWIIKEGKVWEKLNEKT